jgi:ferrous iron transport protein B
MSTVAVVRRETGGWKWPVLQFVYLGARGDLARVIGYAALS